MRLLFTGFAVLQDDKMGVFVLDSNNVVPAIHKNIEAAVADAMLSLPVISEVVQVEVYKNGSIMLMTLDNNIISPLLFDVKLIIDSSQFDACRLFPDWVNFVYRVRTLQKGNHAVELISQHKVA